MRQDAPPIRIDQSLRRADAYRGHSRGFLHPKEPGLQDEYRRLFGHALSPDCSPYESYYGTGHVFQQSQTLADISGFYKAFGLEPSAAGHERADHVAMELEFMAVLAAKEAHALARELPEQAMVCRDAQRKFLEDHLGRWADSFAGRLKNKSSGFYARLAQDLAGFIDKECALLGAKPEKTERLGFAPPEAYDPCFSCKEESKP